MALMAQIFGWRGERSRKSLRLGICHCAARNREIVLGFMFIEA
jgi:hypothetical protein